MKIATHTVRLEVFSDYTCPWCYVGWARLEKALARLPDTLVANVEWRPFEIHPEVPTEGMPVGRMRAAIDSGRYESALSVTNRDPSMMGISGTPTFVFDGRFVASGAQPSEVLIRGFESALSHEVGGAERSLTEIKTSSQNPSE